MTLVVDGVEVKEVVCDGVSLDRVYFGNTLVFEKRAKMLITVGNLGGTQGQFGYSWEFGRLSPNVIPNYPSAGVVGAVVWDGSNGDTPMFTFYVDKANALPANIKVTIGGASILVPRSGWKYITRAEFNALPKSGVHELKVEPA